ncbi:MAG: sigma-70 family RNA polymerase sigma factor [Gaiellaceae bacterium MAG52_C11]|nr:sigma-70 family RNA polymerase sigma factor [Candidatus Gaiellasilicea maunaloa]
MDAEDAELVQRARAGDVDAFGELVRRYERRVAVVLARLLDDTRDVEEATQDVFVKAWRSLERFRGEAVVFTWLYRIAVNEALMRRRRRRPELTELDEETPAAPVFEHADDLRSFLLLQLQALPFDLRAPVVLRDHEGLSNQEVAEALGLSLAATKSRIHRARMQLRVALEKWERN